MTGQMAEKISSGMSKQALVKKAQQGAGALGRLRRLREQGEKMVGAVVGNVAVGGAAGVLAYMRARYGTQNDKGQYELTVGGIPVAAGGAVALNILGFTGALGNYSEMANYAGAGFLAAFTSEIGANLGSEHRKKAAAQTQGYAPIEGNPYHPASMGTGYAPSAYAQPMHGFAAI